MYASNSGASEYIEQKDSKYDKNEFKRLHISKFPKIELLIKLLMQFSSGYHERMGEMVAWCIHLFDVKHSEKEHLTTNVPIRVKYMNHQFKDEESGA